MTDSNIVRLENFLKNRFGFKIPEGVEFKRMTKEKLDAWLDKNDTIRSKVVNLSMNDFLTEGLFFNTDIEEVVSETIKQKGLTIYTVIVSYDGRGEAALATGGNTFNNLKNLEQQGLITRFLISLIECWVFLPRSPEKERSGPWNSTLNLSFE